MMRERESRSATMALTRVMYASSAASAPSVGVNAR